MFLIHVISAGDTALYGGEHVDLQTIIWETIFHKHEICYMTSAFCHLVCFTLSYKPEPLNGLFSYVSILQQDAGKER